MPTATGPLEKVVQQSCRKAAVTAGVRVCNLSQIRRSMVQLGLPDLLLLHRACGCAWMEVKREGGTQSRDQQQFESWCVEAGVPYIIGGLYEMLSFLMARGLWRLPDGVPITRYAQPTTVFKAHTQAVGVLARAATEGQA